MGNGQNSPYRTMSPSSPAGGGRVEESCGLDAFFRDQYDPLVRYLRRRSHTNDDAEEAAQESFTRFIPYVHHQPRAAWKPTLYRIATNLVHDLGRRGRIRAAFPQVSLETQHIVDDQPGPEQLAEYVQQQARLEAAILALPPQCRQVYLMRMHDMETAQIAKRCGISRRMVDKHLANALAHFRQRFGRRTSEA